MERELWLLLYHMALSCDQLTKARYRPAVIVGVYGWAVVHDRPVSWAASGGTGRRRCSLNRVFVCLRKRR